MKPLTLLLLMLFSACLGQEEVRLSKHPYGYKAAVVVTFDTEVVRGGELEAIAEELRQRGMNANAYATQVPRASAARTWRDCISRRAMAVIPCSILSGLFI